MLNISVNKQESRINKFNYKGNAVYAITDQWHPWKNLKAGLKWFY